MLVNAKSARRYSFRCECCGHPSFRSASARKAAARGRDAEKRTIRRRERRDFSRDALDF